MVTTPLAPFLPYCRYKEMGQAAFPIYFFFYNRQIAFGIFRKSAYWRLHKGEKNIPCLLWGRIRML